MELLKKNKGFEDGFFVLALVFAITIFILIVAVAWEQIEPELDTSLNSAISNNTAVNVSSTLSGVGSTTKMFNSLLPFIMIGIIGFLILGASLYLQHPVFAFVGVIILGVAILLGVIYSNVYQEISTSTPFESTSSDFGVFNIFMEYLPTFIILLFIIIIIFLVMNKRGGTGQL